VRAQPRPERVVDVVAVVQRVDRVEQHAVALAGAARAGARAGGQGRAAVLDRVTLRHGTRLP
jgi:hypothetical protein